MNSPTRKNIKSSFRDAIYTNLNIGLNESYFCALMLALGVSEILAGLGVVIPQFIGVIFQLFSIRDFIRRKSLKSRILLFLLIQTIMFVPLIYLALIRSSNAWLIIFILSLYWGSLLSLNPPWNRLIGHTVPKNFRLKFFSLRSQFAQFSVLIGLILAGFILDWARPKGFEINAFILMLIVGFLLKWLSWFEIKKNHLAYPITFEQEPRVSLRLFLKNLKSSESGRLIFFMFIFYIAIYSSTPYFSPFMLQQLKLNYLDYMFLTAIAYFGRVFAFKIFQKKIKSHQIDLLLILSCLGIATTPILWTISQNFVWLFMIEFLSGCYWAGFELSSILLFYHKIKDHERTSLVTYLSFLNTSGMIIGTFMGAFILKYLQTDYNPYLILFGFSSVLRLLTLFVAPKSGFKGKIPKIISYNRVFSARIPFGGLTKPIIEWGKKKKTKTEDQK